MAEPTRGDASAAAIFFKAVAPARRDRRRRPTLRGGERPAIARRRHRGGPGAQTWSSSARTVGSGCRRTQRSAPFHPDTYAAGAAHDVRVRVPQHHGTQRHRRSSNQKNQAQHSAPMFWAEGGPGVPGQAHEPRARPAARPVRRAHRALAWVPERDPLLRRRADGLGRGPGRAATFTYVYRPNDAGTYMFHCHVEDTEHVQMGMTGIVFIRPQAHGDATGSIRRKYAYDATTARPAYDREFAHV